jgi:hypothetical protein
MALKLWRRAELITNDNLSHCSLRRHPTPLRTGADSFKRVLGSALLSQHEQMDAPSAQGLRTKSLLSGFG